MRNAILRVWVPVKGPFRSVKVANKSLADRMGVEVAMPGRFNREPELGASESE
jgi:hypothetical protein